MKLYQSETDRFFTNVDEYAIKTDNHRTNVGLHTTKTGRYLTNVDLHRSNVCRFLTDVDQHWEGNNLHYSNYALHSTGEKYNPQGERCISTFEKTQTKKFIAHSTIIC